MTRWFRFYTEALDDPKVQLLPGDEFKLWVNLLCIAARGNGIIPVSQAVAFSLRVTLHGLREVIGRFVEHGLIDETPEGYSPHNWKKRQYKSDTSNERVQRYRDRKRNVTVTPPDSQKQIDSSSESFAQVPHVGVIGDSTESREPDPRPPAHLTTDPAEIYTESELQGFAFEFDGLDVEATIRELSHWTNRKGITDPIERKNMIWGGMKTRHAKAKLGASLTVPSVASASPQLAASRLARRVA